MVSNDQLSPLVFSKPLLAAPMLSPQVRVRRNTIATNTVRPDSILSTDSFYPMPPPPLAEFSPQKPIERIVEDDFTLKRRKSYPTPMFLSDHNGSHMTPPAAESKPHNFVTIPPPPGRISPLPTQVLCPLPPPTSIVVVTTSSAPPGPLCTPPAPPPPPPPPPPPCAPPQSPMLLLNNIPKPILKQPKPAPKASNLNQPVEFESHLRQAIAKRRQQIDSDQNSVASLDLLGNSVPPNGGRSNSNTWMSPVGHDAGSAKSNGNNNPFVRTRSDVYSANPGSALKKTEENASRLYLV